MKEILENPIITYYKKVYKDKNRMIIPKVFVNNWGREFYMEIYTDKIILRPKNKKEK